MKIVIRYQEAELYAAIIDCIGLGNVILLIGATLTCVLVCG